MVSLYHQIGVKPGLKYLSLLLQVISGSIWTGFGFFLDDDLIIVLTDQLPDRTRSPAFANPLSVNFAMFIAPFVLQQTGKNLVTAFGRPALVLLW